jgi:hypothetical protein
VQQASAEFTHEGRVYGAGTYVVSMAQPKRGVIRWLLGRTFYPDNQYTRDRDGTPMRPYDMSTDNIAEYMGVRVDPVEEWVDTPLSVVADTINPSGDVARGVSGFVIDGRLNDSFKAVNLLWNEGVQLRRVYEASAGLRPGDFIVPGSASEALLAQVADETGVPFRALDIAASAVSEPIEQPRVGMYQRYLGGNIDEGWTRLLLERFGFSYASVLDEELRAGNLNRNYDVIILPDDSPGTMTGASGDDGGSGYFATGRDAYPPQYRSGFGQQGVDALEAFVAAGGTLVTFARASQLPIDEFGLPVRNVVANLPSTEFWCPGSTLRMRVDNTNRIAYGMPEEALGLFLQGNHAYQVTPSSHNDAVERIATFVERDVMRSGWLIGEDHIVEKAAVVAVQYGRGKVVLIGFRAQHRMQTHGTFKFVFNSLVGAAVERP